WRLGRSGPVFRYLRVRDRQVASSPTAIGRNPARCCPGHPGILDPTGVAPVAVGMAVAAADASGRHPVPRQWHLRQFTRQPGSYRGGLPAYCQPALSGNLHAQRIRRQLRVLESLSGGAVLFVVADYRPAVPSLAGTGVAGHRALPVGAGAEHGDDGFSLRWHAAGSPARYLEPAAQLSAGPAGVPQTAPAPG